jgi:hypothetical protein
MLCHKLNKHSARFNQIKIKPEHKFLTADTKDLYVNILIDETINIISKQLKHSNMVEKLYKTVTVSLTTILNHN